MNKLEITLLILVMLLGIGLRSVEVINKNPIFGFDQGRDYLAVREIVIDKKPTLIGSEVGAGMAGLQYIFHGPYYYYSLVVPFILFAGDPYGGLVLMFVFGVFSLVFCFYFVWKNFGLKTALVATFLVGLALSAQSRFMWNSHPATLFILLVFWLAFRISENPNRYFFWACFWAGIIYGFQLAISVSLIVALFVFALFILKIRKAKVYLKGIMGLLLAYLPFLIFEARHGFMAVKSVAGIFAKFLTGQSDLDLATNFKEHLLAFWFNFRATFCFSDRLCFWLMIFFLIVIFYYLIKEKKSQEKDFIRFLLILPLVTFLIFILLESVVWGHYLVHLHLTYILLFAFFVTKSKLPMAKVVFFVLLVLMLPGAFKEVQKGYADLSDHGGVAKIKGKIEAVDYIYQDAREEEFNVLVFTPPVYDYAYRYFLIWYGGGKYGYVPGDKKEGLFYLWIEPDSKKPWSYKGWLETVIKTGEVLKEEKLPGGFVIQKRYAEKD